MRPMLAATVKIPDDLRNLLYPLLGSAKFDGVRAIVRSGVVQSRNLKPIPNERVQRLWGKRKYEGLDGELIVGDPAAKDVYRVTSSAVMSFEGEPDVHFRVFDRHDRPDVPFYKRIREVNSFAKANANMHLVPVYHTLLKNEKQLLAYEESILELGFEGIMLRNVNGLYKHGRSTLNEGWLMKVKRFCDSEAVVVGWEELEHNHNAQERSALGLAKRSSHKINKVRGGVLGALVCQLPGGVRFNIGSGFTWDERVLLWEKREALKGQFVKYKYFAGGVKDKPRFPVFLGFRNAIDL
jgi:DNA ligase 1